MDWKILLAFALGIVVGRVIGDWRWWRNFFRGWRADRADSRSELEALKQRVRELEDEEEARRG